MIRLLIDECCSPELIAVAHERGIEATHINYMGLRGHKDRVLMPVIAGGDYTFVTNDRADFIKLYRHVEVHAGLLIIVPAVPKRRQQELLGRALDELAADGFDLVNQLVEIEEDGTITRSQWPFEGDNRP